MHLRATVGSGQWAVATGTVQTLRVAVRTGDWSDGVEWSDISDGEHIIVGIHWFRFVVYPSI